MKIDEIRAKNQGDLDYELEQMKKELFDLRFKSATQSIASPSRIRELRRTIARIQTIVHERKTGVRGQESR
ncbi:MAG: 50S ribosomal protein L29 [Planctomycetota bacterium]